MRQFISFVLLAKLLKFVINYLYNNHQIILLHLVLQQLIFLNKKKVCVEENPRFCDTLTIYLETSLPNVDSMEKTERYLQCVQIPIVINLVLQ